MELTDLLTDLKEGDVILVHKLPPYKLENLPAPIIRYVTKCYYNHVAIVGSCLGQLYIFEAVSRGFIPTMRLSDYINTIHKSNEICVRRYEKLNTPGNKTIKDVYNNIDELVGRKYDFRGMMLYELIYNISKEWLGSTGEKAKNRVFCSEVIGYGYNWIFEDSYKLTPAQVYLNEEFTTLYESRFDCI